MPRNVITDGGETPDGVSRRQAAAWRDVGHRATWLLVANARADLSDALYPIEAALREDRPIDETAVREARRELDHVRAILEEYAAPIADGDLEPWGGGAGSTTPYGVMAEQLEDAGYNVARPGRDRRSMSTDTATNERGDQ